MVHHVNQRYRIDRRAGHQGLRPSVISQAEVEKCATGCDGLSPSSTTSGTRNQFLTINNNNNNNNNSNGDNSKHNNSNQKNREHNNISNISISTINVRTLQDDIKLATVIKSAGLLGIDVLCMQEVRHTSTGKFVFDDESLKGWQLIWSGHKQKKEHGVGLLLAPHVKLESYQEHMPARIISATINVKGMRLSILNGYAPTNVTKSDAAKSAFYSALGKAKKDLDDNPRYKLVTLGDFNATISSQSKESGSWEPVLGHNNSDRVETNNNGERMLAWCLENHMKIMNTCFGTKRIHRGTWRHAATGKWKRVDYICTSNWVSRFVRSC